MWVVPRILEPLNKASFARLCSCLVAGSGGLTRSSAHPPRSVLAISLWWFAGPLYMSYRRSLAHDKYYCWFVSPQSYRSAPDSERRRASGKFNSMKQFVANKICHGKREFIKYLQWHIKAWAAHWEDRKRALIFTVFWNNDWDVWRFYRSSWFNRL